MNLWRYFFGRFQCRCGSTVQELQESTDLLKLCTVKGLLVRNASTPVFMHTVQRILNMHA